MAKHTVTLIVRCTFEVSAKNFDAAANKAIDQLTEALPDDSLKQLDIDLVTPILKVE